MASNFDDIQRCIELYKLLNNIQDDIASTSDTRYQHRTFESAIIGTRIKARSVQQDTLASVCNMMKAVLSSKFAVKVRYNTKMKEKHVENGKIVDGDALYDEKYILETYSEGIIKENHKLTVTHNKYGWNYNNRNILGRLLTAYSSETTAHILDAVKTGAITNENEFTFGIFKTLINLGVDYDTAISYLAQPAITLLCKNYSANTSAYLSDNQNIILKTLKDLYNANSDTPLGEYASRETIISAIYNKFGKLLNDYYKAEVITEKNINFENLIIDNQDLLDRFDITDETKQLIIDFNVIFNFDKIHTLFTKIIEPILQVSNPDKFGAKQSNRATRDTIDKIYQHGYNESNQYLYDFYCQDGDEVVPFIQKLYPDVFTKTGVDIEKSGYPILAAALKYATVPSTVINSKLFDLEGEGFVTPFNAYQNIYSIAENIRKELIKTYKDKDISIAQLDRIIAEQVHDKVYNLYGLIDKIQNVLGKKLNDKEYLAYKQWITVYLANNCKTLLMPVTVDINGYFKLNDKIADETIETQEEPWNKEVNRILGINSEYFVDFKLEDYELADNDTKLKYIEDFTRLTPIQKLLWIQQNFEKGGIADYINITDRYDSKRKLYYSTLSIDENVDKETLINEFNNSFMNKNSFIRLLCGDLIKYAFIKEGYKFRYGNISKIISNVALLSDNKNGGFIIETGDNITNLKDVLDSIMSEIKHSNLDNLGNEEMIEMFVRSHSNLVKNINISSRKLTKDVTFKAFMEQHYKEDGSYYIPCYGLKGSESTGEIIDAALSILLPNYTYFTKYILLTKNNKTQLYKIEKIESENKTDLYIYPIGILEENEYGKLSTNSDNNADYSQDYYKHQLEVYRQNSDEETTKTIKGAELYKYRNPRFAQKRNTDLDKNYLEQHRSDNFVASTVNDIEEQLVQIDDETNPKSNLFVGIRGDVIKKLMDKSDSIVQTFTINGKKVKYEIKEVSLSKRFKVKFAEVVAKIRESNSLKDIDLSKNEDFAYIYRFMMNHKGYTANIKIYNFKKIEEPVESGVVKELDEERKDNLQYAKTALIINRDGSKNDAIKNIDSIAAALSKTLMRRAIQDSLNEDENDNTSPKSNAARDFKLKVDMGNIRIDSTDSIIRNKSNIFSTSARYYNDEATRIMYMMEHFTIIDDNGEIKEYNIGEKQLYEDLVKITANNPQYYFKLVNLIMYAKNFGNEVYDMLQLDLSEEDEQTNRELKSIAESINRIRNNKILKGDKFNDGAIGNLLNIYFAKKYSTNPLIRSELITIRETFGDINWLDSNIATVNDINNKEVQVVMRYVQQLLTRVRDIEAPKMIADFQNKFDEYYKEIGDSGLDKIIDKEGKWIQPFTEEFKTKQKELRDKVTEAREKYGDTSVEYYKAKLEKSKWETKNVHRPIVKEYYEKLDEITEYQLEHNAELFIKYKEIQKQLVELKNKSASDSTVTLPIQTRLKRELIALFSRTDENMRKKSDKEILHIRQLETYIDRKIN